MRRGPASIRRPGLCAVRISGLRGSAVGDEAGGAPDAALDDRLLGAGGVDDLAVAGVDRDVAGPGDDVTGLGLRLGDRATAVGDLAAGARHGEDRRRTRLSSSHAALSYAG